MAKVETHYWFGIPRTVSFPGVQMDVDRVYMHAEAKDGDQAKKLAYMRQVGSAGSAFEHAVPERLFADPTKPLDDPSQPQGISAVKAIAIAAANGQKVYTLNARNQAYHAGIVAGLGTDADTKAEISNALNAGMEVGLLLPCSQLRVVSRGTSMRRENSAWVRPRRCRTRRAKRAEPCRDSASSWA